MTGHPARFPPAVLALIDRELGPAVSVLDPFAGVGGIHALRPGRQTVGVELEWEWARSHPYTVVGDARRLPFPASTFDAAATSPTYGNRMADTYDGRDGSRRYTYRLALGRPLTPGNTGGIPWGPAYRALHRDAWAELWRVIRPGGRVLVNVKDHYRAGKLQAVAEWHRDALVAQGFRWLHTLEVETPGLRHGAGHHLRAPGEVLHVAEKPENPPSQSVPHRVQSG